MQVVARCCDAKVVHRDGAEFEYVLQRWLHYAFVPPYKVQSRMLHVHVHVDHDHTRAHVCVRV